MRTTDRDDELEYADEMILKIKNQLADYGQTPQRKERKPLLIMELEVVQGI